MSNPHNFDIKKLRMDLNDIQYELRQVLRLA